MTLEIRVKQKSELISLNFSQNTGVDTDLIQKDRQFQMVFHTILGHVSIK